jgi:murein DD-endopeptidase MepM/ murein hydrolase activator NlpD
MFMPLLPVVAASVRAFAAAAVPLVSAVLAGSVVVPGSVSAAGSVVAAGSVWPPVRAPASGRDRVVAAARGSGLQAVPAAVLAAFGWPVAPARVARRFDPPSRPWLPGHRGVDLAAAPSQIVRAAGAGTVVYAGVLAGRGVVSVAHPDGLRTTYEPLEPAVTVGDAVRPGATLGALQAGHPRCPAPACLHFGLRRGDVYLDPLALFGMGRVRLLPHGERHPAGG